MIPMDCHTHTNHSPDSESPFSAMLARAREIGLSVYGVSDHIELCRWYPQEFYQAEKLHPEDEFDYVARYHSAVHEVYQAKQSVEDLTILCGIEMGEPNADFGLAESVLGDQRLDFVIASLHELPGKMDFAFLPYDQMSEDEIHALLDEYFQKELDIAKWGKFDVLGHLTYPLRYLVGDYGYSLDLTRYESCIAECFRHVIQKGKSLEINTSGYRQKYGMPFPHADLLRLYKDLGGTRISLGSDAHHPKQLGGGIEQGIALAREIGFTRLTYFQRHKAQYIAI